LPTPKRAAFIITNMAAKPLFGWPTRVTDGAIEHHLACGIAMDAHFVLQAAAVNAVALAYSAIGLHIELGHYKQD
jgi:hypothetical protein